MNNKILVIGDTILDEYINIEPVKVSDEAHVITSNVINKKFVLGGATNVARNICTLGGQCFYIGLISNELEGQFLELLQYYNIKCFLIKKPNSVQVKTRVVSSRGAQICRFDTKFDESILSDKQISDLVLKIESIIKDYDFVVISKYYNHFLKKPLIGRILDICIKNNKPMIVDNRNDDFQLFKNIDFYKVNFNEFRQVYKLPDLKNETSEIIKTIDEYGLLFKNLIVTRSNLPTIAFTKNSNKINHLVVNVNNVEVKDVSGAGDTFVAAFSLNYSGDMQDCITKCHEICNIVVKKMGTSVVWTYEINSFIDTEILCDQLKKNGKKIVFTNGVFDILHSGHVKILQEAKKYGDYLIVGINSDASVKRIKGPDRPINDELERKKVLEAIRFVDKVIVFNETTCESIIQKINPNIYVKGGDYNLDNLPEKKVLSHIDKVIFVDLVENKSSTKIINKIIDKQN